MADELVTELTDPRCQSPSDQQYDQKNIRRRVYDALNVLMVRWSKISAFKSILGYSAVTVGYSFFRPVYLYMFCTVGMVRCLPTVLNLRILIGLYIF